MSSPSRLALAAALLLACSKRSNEHATADPAGGAPGHSTDRAAAICARIRAVPAVAGVESPMSPRQDRECEANFRMLEKGAPAALVQAESCLDWARNSAELNDCFKYGQFSMDGGAFTPPPRP